MINNKLFEHRPISELMSIVKRDFKKFNAEGLIDEGTVIKTIMWCNDKLGIAIREVKEGCIPVMNGQAYLPKDFEKLYYVCALPEVSVKDLEFKNPFDNNFDRDIIYEAKVDHDTIGLNNNYNIIIKKMTNIEVKTYTKFIELELAPSAYSYALGNSPLIKKGSNKKQIIINDDLTITCPFEEGELYMMYVGNMRDKDGNLLFPFNPLITPFYEWAVKEKILIDAIMNSDGNTTELMNQLKIAKNERGLAWLDAFNITMEKGYGEYVDLQRKRELKWYNQYFKFFQ